MCLMQLSLCYCQGSWSDIRGHSFVLQLSLLLSSILYFVLGAVTAIPVITITRIGLGILRTKPFHRRLWCLLVDCTGRPIFHYQSLLFPEGLFLPRSFLQFQANFFYQSATKPVKTHTAVFWVKTL